MATLKRQDGAQFIIQAYRDTVSARKKSLLAQQLQLLAKEQGRFVRLFRKGTAVVEAVFSSDPGYLLAETVWQQLGKPDHLVYCESLPGNEQVLLVVVVNGVIALDDQIPAKQLRTTLIPFMATKQKFTVVTSGNVMLKETSSHDLSSGHFSFPPQSVASFNHRSESIFEALPKTADLRLQMLFNAIQSERLKSPVKKMGIAVGLLLLGVLGLWCLVPSHRPAPPKFLVSHKPQPYQDYQQAMMSPAPSDQLNELAGLVVRLYNLSGWHLSMISYDGGQYKADLGRTGGRLEDLRRWSRAQHYQLSLTDTGVELQLPSSQQQRHRSQVLYPNTQLTDVVIDRIGGVMHGNSVVLGQTQQHGKVVSSQITIDLRGASPQLLRMIGRQLYQLPIALSSIDLTVQSGLLNGSIHLSVWGSAS